MALIDKASLLMVPSTYEDGTLYNILPSGNKAPDETGNHNGYDQTRADFTFSRGFNLAATRVNADGLIEKGRENLLTRSNSFSSSVWVKGVYATGGQNGYDGSNDAWLITANGANTHLYQLNTSSGVICYSVYAKAGTSNWIRLRLDNAAPTADINTWVNLSDGSIGVDNSIAGYTENKGNGWYRIVIQTNTNDLANVRIYPADSDGSNSTSGSIYIQDAQLEKGLIASDVITTGSSTAQAGILEDMPRINYDANGENGALLLEPQRTNLLAQSEYFGGFTTTEANVTTNNGISPEGLQNASAVIETTGSSNKRILPSSPFLGTGGANYTLSVYVKKIAGQPTRHIYWMCQFGPDAIYAHFDMDDFSVNEQNDNGNGSLTNADIIPVGNDWYRLILSGSISTTGGDYYNQLYFEDTPRTGFNAQSYTGNGSSGFEIYGWQIEQGSHVSSYVPTYGSAATRGADSCSVTGVSDVIPNEGVFYIDMSIEDFENYTSFFQLSEGTNTSIRFWAATYSGDTGLFGQIYVQGVDVKRQLLTETKNERIKAAIRYDSGDIAFYVNGSQLYKGTETFTPEALTRIDNFKLFGNSEVKSGGSVYGLGVFPVLSDSELATLTTL